MGAWEGYLTLKVVEGRKIKMLGDKVVDPYVVLSVGAVPLSPSHLEGCPSFILTEGCCVVRVFIL